jgi:hypothetical protein
MVRIASGEDASCAFHLRTFDDRRAVVLPPDFGRGYLLKIDVPDSGLPTTTSGRPHSSSITPGSAANTSTRTRSSNAARSCTCCRRRTWGSSSTRTSIDEMRQIQQLKNVYKILEFLGAKFPTNQAAKRGRHY